MLGLQLAGAGIQSRSGKKKGMPRIRHPTWKSSRSSGDVLRYLMIRARISASEVAPFSSRNVSHAIEHGSDVL